MPLIIGAKSASAGVTIANSCRFNYADSYLSRTASTNNNSVGKWTFSCWVKRNKITYESNLISFYSDGSLRSALRFDGDDKIRFYEYNSTTIVAKVTNQLFRDTSGWYHIVFAVDKTVASPDTQIYINGVATTSWSTDDDYTQDESGTFDDAETLEINAQNAGGIGGCEMAHVHFCDGTKYAASDFGEFNEDSPTIWQPKSADDISGLTFGDNGFYLNFEDSADLGVDVSGNSNDLTETNLDATDQATDTPTNNFCTMNPIAGRQGEFDQTLFSQGNTMVEECAAGTTNEWRAYYGTMGVSSGKWYWEVECVKSWAAPADTAISQRHGICDVNQLVQQEDESSTDLSRAWGWRNPGGYRNNNTDTDDASYGSYTTGDILQFALDLDNNKLYFGKDGTWEDSGDPTSGATGTGAVSITAGYTYTPLDERLYGSDKYSANFGNPGFTVSSGNADGKGYGNFEYAPPSGYYALCTKNLGAYGG